MLRYPHLAQPIQVGRFTYRNRVIAAPLGRGRFLPSGDPVPRTRDLIAARAKGGCAEVCTGETSVDFQHANREHEPGSVYSLMEREPSFRAYSAYAAAAKENGAVAVIELNHAGLARSELGDGFSPYGPVSYTKDGGVRVLGMDEAMMEEVRENFATAAEFMQRCGYDGVMVFAGHGWLLHQFLSPRTNTRDDQYGGSLENRARFPLSVIRAVRERCGRDFMIEVRVSGSEREPGGLEVEEVAQFCKMLEGLVDLVHVSVGIYHDPIRTREFSSMYEPRNCNVEYAAVIKRACSIPVAVVGGINDPGEADRIIAEGKADLVALGRALSADPEWVNKALSGREDDIAKCIRCFCCFPGPKEDVLKNNAGKVPALKCTMNPLNDLQIPLDSFPEPSASRRVLVIGGGVAGLQAAVVAHDRGHQVTLVEQSEKLGGILNFTDHDLYKTGLREFKDLMVRRVRGRRIDVMLNTAGTPELIRRLDPEAVVIAVGSRPLAPPIRGIETAKQALDVYHGDLAEIGQRVVIVGGGLVGSETGLDLSKMGKQVTLVEMGDAIAPDAYPMHRIALLDQVAAHLTVYTGATCTEIRPDGISALQKDGSLLELNADTVIHALGMRGNTELARSLQDACGRRQSFIIGDCDRAGKVQKAMEDGWLAGMRIV